MHKHIRHKHSRHKYNRHKHSTQKDRPRQTRGGLRRRDLGRSGAGFPTDRTDRQIRRCYEKDRPRGLREAIKYQ